METPSKERQRKWKERQAVEGKKAVTAMLSARTKRLIDGERQKTGETIGDVLERAVDKLFGVTSNNEWYKIPPTGLTNKQKEIIQEVNRQSRGSFFKPSEIVRVQNEMHVPTLTGAEQWDEAEVQLILDYLKKGNLGLMLHLTKKWPKKIMTDYVLGKR